MSLRITGVYRSSSNRRVVRMDSSFDRYLEEYFDHDYDYDNSGNRKTNSTPTNEDDLADAIDYAIRTHSNFDSREPCKARCTLKYISKDANVKNAVQEMRDSDSTFRSLENFISQHQSHFYLHSSGGNRNKTTMLVGVRTKTPFQGDNSHRVFGEFQCGLCKSTWSSAATWKDKWQQCRRCESKCFPFSQHVLLKSNRDEDEDTRRPHHMQRCQKCKEKGGLCCPSMYYSV